MFKYVKGLKETYSPMYFLGALGAGGLAVSFFMYMMFMIPHEGYPMPTFSHIFGNFGKLGAGFTVLTVVAPLGIIFFAVLHFRLLIWNIREYNLFKKTEAFVQLKNSNNEVSLMTIPLTYIMTINVLFILGMVFVPNIWSVVEYLFPFALLAFLSVGAYGLKLFTDYFVRVTTKGGFDFANNNHLSQMIAVFAFAMISVGIAAPAAMSSTKAISVIALFFAIFFAVVAISLIILYIPLGVQPMFKHGISKDAAASLWMMVPIMTILGISAIRMTFGFMHTIEHTAPAPTWLFLMTSTILAVQISFGFIGYKVLKNINYFAEYIHGAKKAPAAYALICPGVASMVFGMFFIHTGLIQTGILKQFSVLYFIMIVPLVYIQFITVRTVFKLNKKLLKN